MPCQRVIRYSLRALLEAGNLERAIAGVREEILAYLDCMSRSVDREVLRKVCGVKDNAVRNREYDFIGQFAVSDGVFVFVDLVTRSARYAAVRVGVGLVFVVDKGLCLLVACSFGGEAGLNAHLVRLFGFIVERESKTFSVLVEHAVGFAVLEGDDRVLFAVNEFRAVNNDMVRNSRSIQFFNAKGAGEVNRACREVIRPDAAFVDKAVLVTAAAFLVSVFVSLSAVVIVG